MEYLKIREGENRNIILIPENNNFYYEYISHSFKYRDKSFYLICLNYNCDFCNSINDLSIEIIENVKSSKRGVALVYDILTKKFYIFDFPQQVLFYIKKLEIQQQIDFDTLISISKIDRYNYKIERKYFNFEIESEIPKFNLKNYILEKFLKQDSTKFMLLLKNLYKSKDENNYEISNLDIIERNSKDLLENQEEDTF